MIEDRVYKEVEQEGDQRRQAIGDGEEEEVLEHNDGKCGQSFQVWKGVRLPRQGVQSLASI